MKPVAHLVDGSLYVCRAWFSQAPDVNDADGAPVHAVHGFTRFLLDLRESLSFAQLKAHRVELAALLDQRPLLVIGAFFLAYVSFTALSLPGATVLELDEEGYHERSWDDLELVMHYRNFCDSPTRYLRHLE